MLLWALLWFVLLAGAGAVLGLLARMLWGKAKALTSEIGEASERLTVALGTLNDQADQGDYEQVARTTTRAGVPGGRRERRARQH
jgi:hypothetical protein